MESFADNFSRETFDRNLSWKFQVNCINDKTARGVSQLKQMFLFYARLMFTFYMFCFSYLQYGNGFWCSASDKFMSNTVNFTKKKKNSSY